MNFEKEFLMPDQVDIRTKLEKIKLIDTLLEDASEIIADMNLGKNIQENKQESELLSLLFQILSLTISISPEYCIEKFTGINSNLHIKKVISEMGANIIQLDRRKFERDRRKLHTYIANDRRSGFSNRRKNKAV
jgi:hypothetical protein